MMWGAGVGVCVVWHIQHEQSVRVTWMHHLDTQGTAGEQARLSRTIERSDRKRGGKRRGGETKSRTQKDEYSDNKRKWMN